MAFAVAFGGGGESGRKVTAASGFQTELSLQGSDKAPGSFQPFTSSPYRFAGLFFFLFSLRSTLHNRFSVSFVLPAGFCRSPSPSLSLGHVKKNAVSPSTERGGAAAGQCLREVRKLQLAQMWSEQTADPFLFPHTLQPVCCNVHRLASG